MPIKKAAKKALRHSKRRRVINRRVVDKTRDSIKKVRKFVTDGKMKEAEEAVKKAVINLDRGYSKGIFKKNMVARSKSRLHAALKKVAKAAK